MPTTINVKDLYKSYQQHVILDGINFTANKGDVVALMGSSGSGKSTLLRCLNLLTLPDRGTIEIDQQAFCFDPAKPNQLSNQELVFLRKRIGMVFQQFNLWVHMTVLENLIEAPVQVLKQPREQAIADAEFLLKKVGLSNKAHHFPAELSGGQQQRAAIARALMMKPEVMLFDEPTSALDPEMVGEVLQVMQQLAAEGMTMLVATHELGFARRVANQMLFLDAGKIIEQGEVNELFHHAKTERLRRFLEAMQH